MGTVFLVMRDKGNDTDGYYYDSVTSVIGIREDRRDACELMLKAARQLYPSQEPTLPVIYANGYPIRIEFRIVEDLYDAFWIESHIVGEAGDKITD